MRRLALGLAFALSGYLSAAAAPRLRLEPCRVGPETVQCGRLQVPEDCIATMTPPPFLTRAQPR